MKKIISLALTLALAMSLTAAAFAQEEGPFTDVPTDHWAVEYIRKAYDDDVIAGINKHLMGDKLFAPDTELTMGQFASAVARTYYWRDQKDEDWVSTDPWYAPYQRLLERMGVMEGVGVEDWNVPMTRYQMAAVLYNVTKDLGIEMTGPAALFELNDLDQIPERYKEAVLSAYQMGLLSGMGDGNFAGDQSLTRAQAAVIYCKLDKALEAKDGPMERVFDKLEWYLTLDCIGSYSITRYPGKLGTAYTIYAGGVPHGGGSSICYVALDGTELNIISLLPGDYVYGSLYYVNPSDIQIDETGEKLSFVTNVREMQNDPTSPSMFGKNWGDTRIVVDVVTGTVVSMEPLTASEPAQ